MSGLKPDLPDPSCRLVPHLLLWFPTSGAMKLRLRWGTRSLWAGEVPQCRSPSTSLHFAQNVKSTISMKLISALSELAEAGAGFVEVVVFFGEAEA